MAENFSRYYSTISGLLVILLQASGLQSSLIVFYVSSSLLLYVLVNVHYVCCVVQAYSEGGVLVDRFLTLSSACFMWNECHPEIITVKLLLSLAAESESIVAEKRISNAMGTRPHGYRQLV